MALLPGGAAQGTAGKGGGGGILKNIYYFFEHKWLILALLSTQTRANARTSQVVL